ncbi:hypothetical protein Tsubulata_032216 [Turnera subulata]|uniref:NAC domain-containing protein n=1 Tax=Turnera subulata TaxID=218843 RepID=A0A9Q0FHF0_9ROSI|nr:hypothetical protein Tsubulata_032216 [Turnera subulata]
MDDDVVNGGKWIASTGNKDIFSREELDHRKVTVGYKRSLNFFIPPANKTIKTGEKKIGAKKGDMIKTEWIMHEYTLFGEEFQEWAVCRIKNMAKEQPKEDHQQQQQEQQQDGEEDHHQDYTYFDNIMALMRPVASQDHVLPLSYNYVDTAPSSANNMHPNLAANPQEQ